MPNSSKMNCNNETYFTIELMSKCKSQKEVYNIWDSNQKFLRNTKILFSGDGNQSLCVTEFEFDEGGCVQSIFRKGSILFLDDTVFKSMETKEINIPLGLLLFADSNIVGSIRQFIDSQGNQVNGLVQFLIDNKIPLATELYLIENLFNLKLNDPNHLFYSLVAMEKFTFFQKNMSFNIKTHSIEEKVSRQLSRLYFEFENGDYNIENITYKKHYLFLLKMISIDFSFHKKSKNKKIKNLLDFMHSTLHAMLMREIYYAACFFDRFGSETPLFFKKIQKGMKNPLRAIKNMAWDMYFIRKLEFMVFGGLNGHMCIPFLFTRDKGLAELMRSCQVSIKSLINQNPRSWYPVDIFEYLESRLDYPRNKVEQYFSNEKISKRAFYSRTLDKNVDKLITSLEGEILHLIN